MTNVLADRQHAGLYRSLQLLADRLGWTLYTPHGHEWWDEGLWQFGGSTYHDDRLARQFLMGPETPDEEFPNVPVRFVTLADARQMRWDYVIASVPDNQQGFARFASEASATYVVQCGNTGQYIDWTLDPIVLNSSEMPLLGRGITYHQELDPIFELGRNVGDELAGWPMAGYEGTAHPTIRSFVHLMNETHAFPIWNELRELLPEYRFARYGHAPPDPDPTYRGNLKPILSIADRMIMSGWGFHDKPVGDGFGHVIHGWAAAGRPLIGHASHYAGKLAEPFWQDGVTCIDLDRHSVPEAAEMIREISGGWDRRGDWDRYHAMCTAIRAVYDQIDYVAEAAAIKALLEG